MLETGNKEMLKREAVRYLGYGRHAVDEQTSALIDRSFSDLQSVVNRKSIYRFFDLEWIDPEHVCFGNVHVTSKSLGRNLRGCEKIVLFGATLGIGVDQLIRRKSLTDMAECRCSAGLCCRASGRVLRHVSGDDRRRTAKWGIFSASEV